MPQVCGEDHTIPGLGEVLSMRLGRTHFQKLAKILLKGLNQGPKFKAVNKGEAENVIPEKSAEPTVGPVSAGNELSGLSQVSVTDTQCVEIAEAADAEIRLQSQDLFQSQESEISVSDVSGFTASGTGPTYKHTSPSSLDESEKSFPH